MSGSLSPGLELDTITIEPVPQKKGIILRHVEYSVKSDSFRSEVTRRYSDFQALGDLLIYRFAVRSHVTITEQKVLERAKLVADGLTETIFESFDFIKGGFMKARKGYSEPATSLSLLAVAVQ